MYILFLAILGVPAFRAEGYRFKARPVCRFCSEVPLLSEEYWQRMFVYYFCVIEVSVCHNEIPLLGEEILLRYIVYIPISRIPVVIVSRCMRGHVASCCRKEGSMQKRKKKKEKERKKEVGRNGRQWNQQGM